MREWNLKSKDPVSLTLAADARTGCTDYCNDQIWSLSLGGGEPLALALQTTFGLRARNFRLFPRFIEGEQTISDPAVFAIAPSVRHFYPNYLLVDFSPFEGIEVEAEYWIPSSQSVSGRMRFKNQGNTERKLRVEWVALLTPAAAGQRMVPENFGTLKSLSGNSSDLYPVVVLGGVPQANTSPFPSLELSMELPPRGEGQMVWAQAALNSVENSFNLARQALARNWDAEIARLDLLNAGLVEIHTGDPDWDAAFSLAQKVAFGLLMQPTEHLPHASFVLARQPDLGYSLRGDGRDYNHLWNGQDPLDAWYLASLILPAAPDLVKGVLLNFLETAGENGEIDWKPGLGGQRSQLLATPLLACLAEKIYQASSDREFVEEVFPPLLAFFRKWFSPDRDRDGDQIPEWDHPMQAGFDDHPLFSPWHAWSQGADISTAESPSLCAFLYRECEALSRFAALLGCQDEIAELQAVKENLRAAVEVSWDPALSSYRYWDRDSHYTSAAEVLGERLGPGEITLGRAFDHPVRLLLRVETQGETNRPVDAYAHGVSPGGQHLVEHLASDRFRRYYGLARATGDRT
ncbi:MAG: hypothetical protein EHM70_08410, partial [Chloroflexota bacterium]